MTVRPSMMATLSKVVLPALSAMTGTGGLGDARPESRRLSLTGSPRGGGLVPDRRMVVLTSSEGERPASGASSLTTKGFSRGKPDQLAADGRDPSASRGQRALATLGIYGIIRSPQ
jgi:hypothetical protein